MSVANTFFPLKFWPQKKSIWGRTWRQLDPKVTPNQPQNGPPGRHFPNFGWNRATLHPIRYLLCFCYIFKVLGRLFLDNFVEKKVLTTSLTRLRFWSSTFEEFYRKCNKIGTPKGGAKPPQIHWKSTFDWGGPPEEPKATKMEPKGTKMTPRGPQNDQKYRFLGNKMCTTNGTTKKKYLDNTYHTMPPEATL